MTTPFRRLAAAAFFAAALAVPLQTRASPPELGAFPAYQDVGRWLQSFATATYGRAFRHLGDERDFDHGHFLFAPGRSAPFAILYHTQELAKHLPATPFAFIDPQARNWIQWLDGSGRIENASRYLRKTYPPTSRWEVFRLLYLPGYESHHTIVDKMLDPALLGVEVAASVQWVFKKSDCGKAAKVPVVPIDLPGQGKTCVALSLPVSWPETAAAPARAGAAAPANGLGLSAR